MTNFMPKVPLAHALRVLPAMLCVVAAHQRCGPQWFSKRAGSTPARLTGLLGTRQVWPDQRRLPKQVSWRRICRLQPALRAVELLGMEFRLGELASFNLR